MSAVAIDELGNEWAAGPHDTTGGATGPSGGRVHRPQGTFPWHETPRDGGAAGHAGAALRTRSREQGGAPDAVYLPPGWPEEVRPPESADWEQSAVAFLLDCCPADYRAHLVLRRHPVVLASLAGQFVESQIRASRDALAHSRAGLGSYVTHDVLDDTIDVLHVEEARLVRTRRAVALVEEALRGRVFIRRL